MFARSVLADIPNLDTKMSELDSSEAWVSLGENGNKQNTYLISIGLPSMEDVSTVSGKTRIVAGKVLW